MILQDEDLIYPWPPEADAYWTEVDEETISLFDDLPEDEFSFQAEQFYSQLHQQWQDIDHQLAEQFYSQLHQQWQDIDHQNLEEE